MRLWQRIAIGGVAGVLCLTVGIAYKRRHTSTSPVNPEVGAVVVSTKTPDETVPQKRAYQALPSGTQPEEIVIPSINVDGFVQRVGIDQNSQVAVPTNIHLAGWFAQSQQPGDKGLSIIDGHLDGLHTDGIFRHLVDVKVGDPIKITLGDGTVRAFTVMSVQTVLNADVANILFSQDPAVVSQLNLVTCGGTYVKTDKGYDSRFVVMARLN